MWRRSFFPLRKFASDPYDPEFLRRILSLGNNYSDARAFDEYNFVELKKRVSPEIWNQITMNDELFKEIGMQITDFQDVKPIDSKYVPPSLSRPAFLLDERERRARRLAVDFHLSEKSLKKERLRGLNAFPALTSDDYEVHIGVILMREPVWLTLNQTNAEWFKLRHNTNKKFGLFPKAKDQLLELPEKPVTDDPAAKKRAALEKRFDTTREVYETDYIKGSLHFLEANPYESDPREMSYAGGNNVYLLLKDKHSEKWVFPTSQAIGFRKIGDCRDEILGSICKDVEYHHLGPSPVLALKEEFEKPLTLKRPKYFEEDEYEMVFKRTQILFPRASAAEVESFLLKRYNLSRVSEANERVVKGRKTFFFRTYHVNNPFQLVENERYSDWAWVPKVDLNKYMDRENYYRFINSLNNY
jgi:hypothetical protein